MSKLNVQLIGVAEVRDMIALAVAEEREACAKVCEDLSKVPMLHWARRHGLRQAAEVIRGRGQS